MLRPFIALLFVLLSSTLLAQQRLPVFGTPTDSATYANTEDRLARAMRNPGYSARIDSLMQALALLRQKAIRYRTVYRQSFLFTRYDQRPADLHSITRLSLAGYTGNSLPDTLFLMKNLTELELVNTCIRELPSRLNELTSLKKISLLNNRPAGRLKLGLNQQVKTLVINDDEYDHRPRSFRRFKALTSLDLSRSNLARVPTLRGAQRLTRLAMNDNQLSQLDIKKGMSRLEDLSLTGNKLTRLTPAIARLKQLKKINLNGNQITALPTEIGKLSRLEELSLYKNSLTTLPAEIYKLGNLRVVDLYYNQLVQLDTAIWNWGKLEVLYAANNQLFTLPANLGSLRNLRELYLHHNRISSLPASLRGLDSLRVLRANDNLLLEFPDFLLQLRSLENLDLAANHLTHIQPGLFELPKLRILSLKGNPLGAEARTSVMECARKAVATRQIIIHLEGLTEVPRLEERR